LFFGLLKGQKENEFAAWIKAVRGLNERMVKDRNHGSDERARGSEMSIRGFAARLTAILMAAEAAH
jgi:hypothetical protein